MTTQESNTIRDTIIGILESNGVTNMKPVYPLLHYMEARINNINDLLGDKIDRLGTVIKDKQHIVDVYDQEYQELCRIVLALYKTDKEAIKQMIDEMPGDVFSKFQKHIGV